jgi:hypothetical protein
MPDLKDMVFDLIAEATVEVVDEKQVKLTLDLPQVIAIAQEAGMPLDQIGALLDIDIEVGDDNGEA